MSENNEGGLVIPVTVTRKNMKQVDGKEKHSKASVLFINIKGHAHMVPEDIAKINVKKNKGYIMDRSHKEYMKYFQMAHGVDEKIGTSLFLQKGGKAMSITDASRFDVKSMIEKESIEAAKAQKEAKDK